MDNGMENMLDMYLFETNSLLEQLDEILLGAEKAGTFTTDDVNEIFRIMHTIKGSSAMMDFSSLMTIAHRIEDLFFFIRENSIDNISETHRHELFDLMFHSTDCLRAEVSKVENNEPLSTNIDSIIEEINTFLHKISTTSEESDNEEEESDQKVLSAASNVPNDGSAFYIRIFFDEGCGMENLRAFMLVTSIKDVCENLTFYPEDIEKNSDSAATIIEKGFVMGFCDVDLQDGIISCIKNASNIQTYEIIEGVHAPQHQAEPVQEEASVSNTAEAVSPEEETISAAPVQKNVPEPSAVQAPKKPAPTGQIHTNSNKQSLISVNLTKLDKLMAIVGEIVITESMVTSSPEIQGLKLDSFTKSARQLRKLTDELQDIVMSIRMVPVAGAFQKMNRIVRDMSQKLGKDVRLTIIGENTEVDKTIVDSIADPIMHIVRNSMDHGIEDNVEDRIKNGKDPQGEIVLSAEHTGSEVIISVHDDGGGIDANKVLIKAKNNGLLAKAESEYTKKEILSFLMMPGFSTNEAVTEFSGRGVGMDVVKKNVEKVGGIVTISSDFGQGTTTTMKIPLTLAIVDGMEVSVGNSIFTIPITNIRQSFKASNDEVILDADKKEIIKRMDNFYPIIRIHEMYGIETEITNIEDGILVWVEGGDKSYCLFVDELLGEQQVVVKPLPAYLNSFNIKNSGIAGCTILGDGNISIILDIATLHSVSSY